MPNRRGANAVIDSSLCRRCQAEAPVITIRAEPLCSGCFRKYVSTKVVKRMETFGSYGRHDGQARERLFLLPLSLGCCSIALLHVLTQQLKGQLAKSGRRSYRLHVLHVSEGDPEALSMWSILQSRYPEHEYSSTDLSDVVNLEGVSKLFSTASKEVDTDQDRWANESIHDEHLRELMSSLPSATSKADVVQILRQRLIAQYARKLDCDAILWGHSTTRLAERTLAETAKGRGFSLPWMIADGKATQGMPSYYPLRELLSTELAAYASHADPPFDDIVIQEEPTPTVNFKNTSIDELMRQYFGSAEKDYPSIVANVVRTTDKLQAPVLFGIESQCELCELPLQGQAPARSRLCYGCIRNLPLDISR